MAAGDLAPGARLGAYRVEALLGRGGMGAVYRVVDDAGRAFALKVLLAAGTADEAWRRRFKREAAAARLVRHRGVVSVVDVGEEKGVPFLVLELVPGGSLKALLKTGGAMEWRRAAALGAEIARALAAIHGAGLVHRDLKPDNVLLDAEGRARVSDFGLVRGGAASGLSRGTLTRTGELVGTLEYMAPEQAETSDVDARADLYALGGTLYAMLTGGPPFTGFGLELISKHLRAPPRPPREVAPEIPERLERLVLGLLAKNPGDRPASAEEVARALEAIAGGAKKESAPRRRAVLVVALLAVLAGSAATVGVARAKKAPAAVATPPTPPPTPSPPPPVAPPRIPDRYREIRGPKVATLVAVWGGEERRDAVQRLRASGRGERIIAAYEGGAASVWETATGRETSIPRRAAGDRAVADVALSFDGKTAYTASGSARGEQPVLVCDAESGRVVRRLGNKGERATAVLPTTDGRFVFIGIDLGEYKSLEWWDARTGSKRGQASFMSAVGSLRWRHDDWVEASLSDGSRVAYDAKLEEVDRDDPRGVRVSPVANMDHWRDRFVLYVGPGGANLLGPRETDFVSLTTAPTSDGGFAPDGAIFATANERKVHLRDTTKPGPSFIEAIDFNAAEDQPSAVVFPGSDTLLVGTRGGAILRFALAR